jgi:hypothetical protein
MNLKEFTEKYGNKEVEEAKLKELLGIKESKVWKPRLDDNYWWVNSAGEIYQGFWGNTGTQSYRYSVGNCYKTEEEAIFARDKQIFMTKLERDFEENTMPIKWHDQWQEKWYIVKIGGKVVADSFWVTQLYGPATTNKEWLENYIKENEEDIKKYLFGIGE